MMRASTTPDPGLGSRIDKTGIVIFLLVAYLAAWLICLPLWLAPRHLSVGAGRGDDRAASTTGP